MTIESETKALNDAVAQFNTELATFMGGTKAASTRARKQLQTIAVCAKALRGLIQEKANESKPAGGKKTKGGSAAPAAAASS